MSYLDEIAYFLAHERARYRRDVRYAAIGRIGFILTYDSPRLPPPIVALERHRRSEMYLVWIGEWGDRLRAGAPLLPITQIASYACQRIAVGGNLRLGGLAPSRSAPDPCR